MGKVIACVNEKGGVSKTTTVKNLSAGLVSKGYSVLAIDTDPSGNLTKSCIVLDENDPGSICGIMSASMAVDEFEEDYGIRHHDEGFDIVTSSGALHSFENKLNEAPMREMVLGRYVDEVRDKYDYILIDSPAGLGIFVNNALFCADEVLIPTQAKILDVEAMQNLYQRISLVRKHKNNTKPVISGVLFTQVRPNTINDRNIMDRIVMQQGDRVHFFKTFIPLASKIPESDIARKSIFKYASNSIAALHYSDFIEEFLAYEAEMDKEA